MEQIEAPALSRKPPDNCDSLFLSTPRQRPTLQLGNVLDKLTKRLQPKAKRLLREVMNADTRKHAEAAIATFETEFGSKYEKAVECLFKDRKTLLTLYDFPAEHWKHLRRTNAGCDCASA